MGKVWIGNCLIICRWIRMRTESPFGIYDVNDEMKA